jgi:predicted nuclease with TOPRIM domain
MTGPRSVSAEHDYLVEQIEELKRRLLERNREYEALRRRERRLHNDVFERDERMQQMQLTIADLESALLDRTSEMREVESQHERAMLELDASRRNERTREVVGRVFQDSLGLVRDHTKREDTRERIIEDGPQKRTLSTPSLDDIHTLAGGEEIELDKKTETLTQGEQPEQRPNSPGGSGDPVIYEDEESES